MGEMQPVVIVVVEDDADTRNGLVDLLTLAGFCVLSAGSASEALEISHNEAVLDILIADVRLPDGHGTVMSIEMEEEHPEMRTIFVSGSRVPVLRGTQTCLLKPVSFKVLMESIQSAMGTECERLPVDPEF